MEFKAITGKIFEGQLSVPRFPIPFLIPFFKKGLTMVIHLHSVAFQDSCWHDRGKINGKNSKNDDIFI